MEQFPAGFQSRRVTHGDLTLRIVSGGQGAPVLLIPGWPQTWYAWRHVMPLLAADRTVIVIEPRGMGASDKPKAGYDLGTMAQDMVAMMEELGHRAPFPVIGHDIGAWIAYAMAADYPTKITRAALIDAAIPGVSPAPSALAPAAVNNRLWHFGFNRLADLNEQLVRGREALFFGWQFRTKAARQEAFSEADIAVYVDAYSEPEAMHAGFEWYRAIDTDVAQNAQRKQGKLAMPLLIVAGEKGVGQAMLDGLAPIGDTMTGHVLPGVGHYVPEEAPQALADLIRSFVGIG